MRSIIVIIIVIVAVSVIIDALKKRKAQAPADPSSTSQRLMTANEMPPTETGKMRVREIVESLKQHPDPDVSSAAEAEEAAEEKELPDPFDTK